MRQQPTPVSATSAGHLRGRSERRRRRSRGSRPRRARRGPRPPWSCRSRARARPSLASRSITGTTRRSSSSSATGSAPGRVDSPPTSRMSAPSAASRSPCSTAASASRNSPPSENESGVTLTTPMISTGRSIDYKWLMTLYEFLLFIHISARGLGWRGAVQPGPRDRLRPRRRRAGDPAIRRFLADQERLATRLFIPASLTVIGQLTDSSLVTVVSASSITVRARSTSSSLTVSGGAMRRQLAEPAL